MIIYLSVKQAGKRKEFIKKQQIELTPTPTTLRELLTQLVRLQVEAYNRKETDDRLLQALLPEDLDTLAETGKIAFGQRQDDRQADAEQAISTALLAYQDGLFRVFLNDEELTEPDTALELPEGAVLTLIRFTMLAGRMW